MNKKPYDINDLVEDDINHEETFYKGGKGSGVKGHRTPKQMAETKTQVFEAMDQIIDNLDRDDETMTLGQMVDAVMYIDEDLELIDRKELLQHVKSHGQMKKSDINDLVAEDINHEETFFKGGPGSGRRKNLIDNRGTESTGGYRPVPKHIAREMSAKLKQVNLKDLDSKIDANNKKLGRGKYNPGT